MRVQKKAGKKADVGLLDRKADVGLLDGDGAVLLQPRAEGLPRAVGAERLDERHEARAVGQRLEFHSNFWFQEKGKERSQRLAVAGILSSFSGPVVCPTSMVESFVASCTSPLRILAARFLNVYCCKISITPAHRQIHREEEVSGASL